MKFKRVMSIIALAALVAIIGAAAFSGSALAAKGGNGGGKGGKPAPAPTVTLTVSPNSVQSLTQYTVSGSGFTPGAQVNLVYYAPDCCVVSWKLADASGNVVDMATAGAPGTYKIVAKQYAGRDWVEVGSVTFIVY